MEKRLVVVVLLGIVVIAIVLAVNFNQVGTGQATLTPNVNYGPIDAGSYVFKNCRYLTADDGWSVTSKASVEYFDLRKGRTYVVEDACEVNQRLKEYDCNKDGYMLQRIAICGLGTECKSGACVPKRFG